MNEPVQFGMFMSTWWWVVNALLTCSRSWLPWLLSYCLSRSNNIFVVSDVWAKIFL